MQKRLISFIPFKHVMISTNLSLNEIVNLFSNSISPQWDVIWQAPPRNIKELQGSVSQVGFNLRSTDYYRGSLTYLVGRFIPDANGVKIEMYLTGPIYFILPLFFGTGLCVLLGRMGQQDYIMIFGGCVFCMTGVVGLFVEADKLDLLIGQMLEKYIVE